MSNDWIEHDGGPQPVDDETWVEAQWPFAGGRFSEQPDEMDEAGELPWEGCELRYRVLNQHLIDAARLEGIRLGLEAAKRHAEAITALQSGRLVAIPSLDPETIAREAVLDQLTREAQAQGMGYAEEAGQ